ncbi:hypothetical protein ACA910_008901 [Epithemia clementina (nom. ined.)]
MRKRKICLERWCRAFDQEAAGFDITPTPSSCQCSRQVTNDDKNPTPSAKRTLCLADDDGGAADDDDMEPGDPFFQEMTGSAEPVEYYVLHDDNTTNKVLQIDIH